MRRKDKSSTDSESLLREAPVCRLGFSGEGTPGHPGESASGSFPYVVPLHFAWDGEVLYLHCALEGEKLRRLSRDERVCVEIDEFGGVIPGSRPCGFSSRYRSLIAFGRAQLVQDEAEKRRALAALTVKYAGPDFAEWEFGPREVEAVTVIKIQLSSVSVKSSGPA